ncbi:MAG: tetratricopeptide repeat protein [Anaerolineae bacterium]|nr:tetratricopeptide repeat protein [Anaerolineae bacterium]
MEERLSRAIQLRKEKKVEEARELMLALYADYPSNAQVNYHCAWVHDLLGLEREAIPFYEKAVQTGLSGEDLQGALLGMGSTYRCIGEYQKAHDTFQQAIALFPARHEFRVFLAITWYNLGQPAKAMELLLNSLVETSNDEGVIAYRNAIQFYADKLDETW